MSHHVATLLASQIVKFFMVMVFIAAYPISVALDAALGSVRSPTHRAFLFMDYKLRKSAVS